MSMTLQSATSAAYAQQSSAPQSRALQFDVHTASTSLAQITATRLMHLMLTQLKSPQTVPKDHVVSNGYISRETEIRTGLVTCRAIQPHLLLAPLVTPSVDDKILLLKDIKKSLFELTLAKTVAIIKSAEGPQYAPYSRMLNFIQPDIGADLARSQVIKSLVLFATS